MAREADPRGRIYQEKDGRYRLELSIGAGKRVRFRGDTRAEVIRKRDDYQAGRTEDRKAPAPTVSDWMNQVDQVLAGKGRTESYRNWRSGLLRTHVLPYFGDRPIDTIDSAELLEHQNALLRSGLAPSTVSGVRKILRYSFTMAAKMKVTDTDITSGLPAIAEQQVSPPPLSDEEFAAVVAVVQARKDHARWLTALVLGLRQSEVLGLCWNDIDWFAGELTVTRQLRRVPWAHGCLTPTDHTPSACPLRRPTPLLVTTKTRSSNRTLPIPKELLAILREHRRVTDLLVEAFGRTDTTGAEHGYLVFTGRNLQRLGHRSDARTWKVILDTAGVDHRGTHSARHTVATSMLEDGVDSRVVAAVLGWSSTAQAMRYQHPNTELTRQAAGSMIRKMNTPARASVHDLRKRG